MFPTLIINQHIRMISERSCDTEDVMMLKIQLCITTINYVLKYIKIISHNITFFCIFGQINATLMSIRHFFKKKKHKSF